MRKPREIAKSAMPYRWARRVRAIRRAMEGPPIESVAIRALEPVPVVQTGPRVTFVLPTLRSDQLFGGIQTGLDVFFRLVTSLRQHGEVGMRIVVEDADPEEARRIVSDSAARSQVGPGDIRIEVLGRAHAEVGVCEREVFLTFNWWTTLNTVRLLKKSSSLYRSRRPVVYLIQDYEPHFYPFSAAHLLARQALSSDELTAVVYNGQELFHYAVRQGHSSDNAYVIGTSPVTGLSQQVGGSRGYVKEKLLVAYCRPSVPRNCYSLVEGAIREWSRIAPQFHHWSVVSVGERHRAVRLHDGRTMESMGKLPIEEYVSLLARAAVGLSLMASPHPSYPPLEMAQSGVHVLTNSYPDKDLSAVHPNITAVEDVRVEALAAELAALCHRFELASNSGVRTSAWLQGDSADPLAEIERLASELARVLF